MKLRKTYDFLDCASVANMLRDASVSHYMQAKSVCQQQEDQPTNASLAMLLFYAVECRFKSLLLEDIGLKKGPSGCKGALKGDPLFFSHEIEEFISRFHWAAAACPFPTDIKESREKSRFDRILSASPKMAVQPT